MHRESLIYIPKRLIVSLLTSFGLLILTVIQTNFAITNSLILNPSDSNDNQFSHTVRYFILSEFNSIRNKI